VRNRVEPNCQKRSRGYFLVGEGAGFKSAAVFCNSLIAEASAHIKPVRSPASPGNCRRSSKSSPFRRAAAIRSYSNVQHRRRKSSLHKLARGKITHFVDERPIQSPRPFRAVGPPIVSAGASGNSS